MYNVGGGGTKGTWCVCKFCEIRDSSFLQVGFEGVLRDQKNKTNEDHRFCVCVCCCARSMVFDRDRIRAKKKYINNMVVRENKSGRKVGVELVDAQ